MSAATLDPAFALLRDNIAAYSDLVGEVRDDAAGVRMQLEEVTIETPIELEVHVGPDGKLELGCAPPVYPVEVSVEPILHRFRVTLIVEAEDGRG